ncbi:MAG: hypothetical protein JSS35_00430, partial [Proteobacteria bacterium]|nr:hypothetical protein [Pseudomonadota bacterium]
MKTPMALAASAAILALGMATAPHAADKSESKAKSTDQCFWARNVTSF